MQRLIRHSWPGNVRELENVIERAVALETTEAVLPERLPDLLAGAAAAARGRPIGSERVQPRRAPDRIERDLVRRRPRAGRAGTGEPACELLGITPRSLRYLIRKHGLPAERG